MRPGSIALLALLLPLGCTTVDPSSGRLSDGSGLQPPTGSGADDTDDGAVDPDAFYSTPDTGELTVHPDLTFPEDHPCFDDVLVPEDRVELTFSFSCDVSDLGWVPGKYVVGVTDGGYLREIQAVERTGDTWLLVTSYAGLGDVVANASLSLQWESGGGARGPVSIPLPEVSFGDAVPIELTGGEVGFDGSFDYDVDWGWFRIQGASLDIAFEPFVEFTTSTTVQEGISGSWSKNLADWHVGTLTAFVGPVPVVAQIKLRQTVKAEVSLPGEVTLETAASVRVPMDTHGEYRRGQGWSQESSWDIQTSVEFPTIEADVEAEVKVTYALQPTMLFYGVAGPALSAEPYIKGTLGPDCEGVTADVAAGVDFKLALAALYEKEGRRDQSSFANWDIANFERSLWTETLDWPTGFVPPSCNESCNNGLDDDGDGLIDCQDVDDCAGVDVCGQCGLGETLSCGQSITKTAADFAGATNQLDAYACNVGNYDGGEFVFEWTAPSSSEVSFELVDPVPTQTNMDLMILEASQGCHGNACVDWAPNSALFEPVAGTTYYLVVDGYDSDMGDFEVLLDCAP